MLVRVTKIELLKNLVKVILWRLELMRGDVIIEFFLVILLEILLIRNNGV